MSHPVHRIGNAEVAQTRSRIMGFNAARRNGLLHRLVRRQSGPRWAWEFSGERTSSSASAHSNKAVEDDRPPINSQARCGPYTNRAQLFRAFFRLLARGVCMGTSFVTRRRFWGTPKSRILRRSIRLFGVPQNRRHQQTVKPRDR